MKRNNIQLYLNRENTCLAIPRKYSTCLLKENYLSEFDTEEEKELAMENLLLLDEVPTKDSKKLVNSGDLANVLENIENGINNNIENLSTETGNINEEIEGINEEIGDIKDNINTIETNISNLEINVNNILNEVNNLNVEIFNKYYDPENFSGMGKIYLLKNIVNGINLLVLNMLEDDEGNPLTHTIFVIQYDYYLDDKIIHIPSNCVLWFEGGSLNEGTLVGDDTIIIAAKTEIFSNIIIDGTWNVPEITTTWFSDAAEDNMLKQVFKLANISVHNIITIEDGTYNVSCLAETEAPINIDSNTDVNLIGRIKLAPNSLYSGFAVNIVYGAKNINVYGNGVIEGDKFKHDYQTGALALGNKILSTNASNTPKGIVLYTGNEQITGTLEVSESSADSVYWVRNGFNDSLDPSGETGYVTTNYTYYQVVSGKWKAVNTCESCHGINMHECYNVSISNITIKNCAGDCVYIGYRTSPANRISLINLTLDNGRRQGISITSGKNILIDNCLISNINGTSPQSGIDVEPNANSFITNLSIRNTTINNVQGAGISLHNTKILGMDNIVIENVIIDGCYYGIGNKKTNIHGLSIRNVTVKNNDMYGLVLSPYEKIAFDPEEEDGPYNIKDATIENFICDARHDGADAVTNIIMGINVSVNNCTFNGQTLLRSYLPSDATHEIRGISVSNCTFNAPDGVVQIHNACSVTGGTIVCKHLRTPNGHTVIRDAKITTERISSSKFDAEAIYGASYIIIENCYLECPYVRLGKYCNVSGNTLMLGYMETDINTVIRSNAISFMENGTVLPSRCNIVAGDYCDISFNYITASNKGRNEDYRDYVIRMGNYNAFRHNACTLKLATDDNGNLITTLLASFLFIADLSEVSFNKLVITGTNTFVWRPFYIGSYAKSPVLFNNIFDYDPILVEGETFFASSYTTYRDGSKNRFGTSEERPELTSLDISFEYFDTDLNKPIYWNGTRWIDEKGFTANISKGTYELALDLISNNKLTPDDIGYEFYVTELERSVYYSLKKLYEYSVKLDYVYESNLLIENNTYYVEVSNSVGVVTSENIYFSKVNDNPTEEDLIPITNNSYIIAPNPSVYPYIYINGIDHSNRRYVRIYTPTWIELHDKKNIGTTYSRTLITEDLTEDDAGYMYFDTDLGKPIYWNGTNWVDSIGAAVTHRLIYVLTNITASNYQQPDNGAQFTTVLTPDEGYSLPSSIEVRMNNENLTVGTDYTYNISTGEITILGTGGEGGVTEYINITATAIENNN